MGKAKIGSANAEAFIGDMSDNDNNYVEDELDIFIASCLDDEEDPDDKAEIGDTFKAMEHLVTKQKTQLEKSCHHPQQMRASRPSKRQKNTLPLTTGKVEQNDGVDVAVQPDSSNAVPILEIPIFDLGKCVDPENKWPVLEVPHFLDEMLGIPEPMLIPGP